MVARHPSSAKKIEHSGAPACRFATRPMPYSNTFRIASMVFQLRVVAGTPKCFSTTAFEYVRPLRRTLRTNLAVTPTIRTSHFDPAGCSIGSFGFDRGAFSSTVTNRPISFPAGASPNQSPSANATTSDPLQTISSGSNASRRKISFRNFASLTFSRTTNVPAAPIFTTPNSASSFASLLG